MDFIVDVIKGILLLIIGYGILYVLYYSYAKAKERDDKVMMKLIVAIIVSILTLYIIFGEH